MPKTLFKVVSKHNHLSKLVKPTTLIIRYSVSTSLQTASE